MRALRLLPRRRALAVGRGGRRGFQQPAEIDDRFARLERTACVGLGDHTMFCETSEIRGDEEIRLLDVDPAAADAVRARATGC